MQIYKLSPFPAYIESELRTLGDEQHLLNNLCKYRKNTKEDKHHYKRVWREIYHNIKEIKNIKTKDIRKIRLRYQPFFQLFDFNDTREKQASMISRSIAVHHIRGKEEIPSHFLNCKKLLTKEIALLFSFISKCNNWEEVAEEMDQYCRKLSTAQECKRYFDKHIKPRFSFEKIRVECPGEWTINLHVFIETESKLGKRKQRCEKGAEKARDNKRSRTEIAQKEEKELLERERGKGKAIIQAADKEIEEPKLDWMFLNIEGSDSEYSDGDSDYKASAGESEEVSDEEFLFEEDLEIGEKEEKFKVKREDKKESLLNGYKTSRGQAWSNEDEESLLENTRKVWAEYPGTKLNKKMFTEITERENTQRSKDEQRTCAAYTNRIKNHFLDIIEKIKLNKLGNRDIKIHVDRNKGKISCETLRGRSYKVFLDQISSHSKWTEEEKEIVKNYKGNKRELPKVLGYRHDYASCIRQLMRLEKKSK